MIQIIKKYKDILLYLIFGALTTAINTVSYHVLYNKLGISNLISTVLAFILAVIFAFVTNKLFVFESKSFRVNVIGREIISFFSCRILTGILDVIIMYVTVDILELNSILFKIISNIIVIILNFMASKLIVFKNKTDL